MPGNNGGIRRTSVNRRGPGVRVENALLDVRRVRISLGVTENPGAGIAFIRNTRTWGHAGRHYVLVVEGVLVPGERHLMEIAGAGDGLSLCLGFLQSRQEHPCQDRYYGNDDQKLD